MSLWVRLSRCPHVQLQMVLFTTCSEVQINLYQCAGAGNTGLPHARQVLYHPSIYQDTEIRTQKNVERGQELGRKAQQALASV